MRERFHPFNTARIAHRALRNSTLLVDHTVNLAAALSAGNFLHPRAALLYPSAEASLISDIPTDQWPAQLVILDGTWHHAKTLVRDIPALASLPRVRLAPPAPSRYRIRREPTDVALSTVEAIIAALGVFEPETAGVNLLIAAFDQMVERQLAHPKAEYGARHVVRRRPYCGNTPAAIVEDLDNIVVAYGESALGARGTARASGPPVYWVAERLGTGETFRRLITPAAPLVDEFLQHLRLNREDFADAVSLDEASRAWQAYLRPTDTLAVFNQGTIRLLRQMSDAVAEPACLLLKSVALDSQRRLGTLEEIVAAEQFPVGPALHPGRAGERLANAVALTRFLHAQAKANVHESSVSASQS